MSKVILLLTFLLLGTTAQEGQRYVTNTDMEFVMSWAHVIFLAVQDSSIGDLVSESLSDTPFDFRAV